MGDERVAAPGACLRGREFAFFHDLDDEAFGELRALARWRRFAVGTPLLRAGEPGDFFCVLLAGTARIVQGGRAVGLLAAGDCCGEMAWLRPNAGARRVDVVAESEGELIEIPVAALAAASCRLRHGVDRAFLHLLLDRLEQADSGLASVTL